MALPTAPVVRPPRPYPAEERYPLPSPAPLTAHGRAVAVVAAAGYHPDTGVTRLVVNRSLWAVMPPVGTPLDIHTGGGRGGRGTRLAVLVEVYGHGILVRSRAGVRAFVTYIDLYAPTSHTRILFPRMYAERVDAVCDRLRELSPRLLAARLAAESGLRLHDDDDGGEGEACAHRLCSGRGPR